MAPNKSIFDKTSANLPVALPSVRLPSQRQLLVLKISSALNLFQQLKDLRRIAQTIPATKLSPAPTALCTTTCSGGAHQAHCRDTSMASISPIDTTTRWALLVIVRMLVICRAYHSANKKPRKRSRVCGVWSNQAAFNAA
jgi:hypothetical protein